LSQGIILLLLVIGLSYPQKIIAQSNPLIPNISWKQSLELKKDNYVFYQIHQDGDTSVILAAGKRDKYILRLVKVNDKYQMVQETMTKPIGQYVFWAGYHNHQYIEITEKQRTINEDELYLHFPKKDTFVTLFSYRSDYQHRANFIFRSDINHLYLAFKPPGRNKDSATIYILSIDSLMRLKYDTLHLGYNIDLVEIDQFEVKEDHYFFVLRRYYNNKIEKRQFKRNYNYEEISFNPSKNSILINDMQLEESLYYPHIKYFPKHHQTVGMYSKKTENKAIGIYIFEHPTHKSYHIPFDSYTIKKTRKPFNPFKPRQIPGLFPDMILNQDSGVNYYFEQYYLTAVAGSAGNATYNFHYNHLIVLSLDSNASKPNFSILPKYQKTYNDYGQISSYKLLTINKERWLFFNSHKKYIQKEYKTPNTNKIEFSYLINATNFKEIIPVTSNNKIAVLTDLIIKNKDKTYTVFGYKKGNLWIGEFTY
jgi:hypothetical protein